MAKKGIKLHSKRCKVCKKLFFGYKQQIYCSSECYQAFCDMRPKKSGFNKKNHVLSTGTVGAISELKVAIDLLNKGYGVFRAMSPSSSCDLVAIKGKKSYLIEVKTDSNKIRRYVYPNNIFIKADILACVIKNKIIYQPDIFKK